jgi:hypothetical protein
LTSTDYSLFERSTLELDRLADDSYDVFLSAYNDSTRVKKVFAAIVATQKTWLLHAEYEYTASEEPIGSDKIAGLPSETPIEFWRRVFQEADISPTSKLAIDITGMMRPYILILPLMLSLLAVDNVYIFYSDPISYFSGESTVFSKGPVNGVGVVPGMEGQHLGRSSAADILVIGAGYDHELIKAAAESKRSADHYLLVGLPSLQPHMYQESLLRVSRVSEFIRDRRSRSYFYAPANDPFMTAQVLSEHISKLRADGRADNIYLSPVGVKTQVLGFAWYFFCEAQNSQTSMIFPYSSSYSRETSSGLGSIHRFKLEFS